MAARGVGRVRFLALRQVIAAELAEGWSMVEIYRRHQDQLGIKVGQFRLYVNAYIAPENLWTGRKAAATPDKVQARTAQPPTVAAPMAAATEPPRRITRSINLKREDLI